MGFATTRENFLVLDKNALRAAAAVAAKADADARGFGVVVIDTTFKEIVRGGNWPGHYVNDFRDWTDRPGRMSVSWGSGELLREERDSGRPVATVIDTEMTAYHRQLLARLAANDHAALTAATAKVQAEAARMAAAGGELNAAERLETMRRMVDSWWAHGNAGARQAIQVELNDPADGPLIRLGDLVMTTPSLREPLESALTQNGFSPRNATSVLSQPTFTNFLHSAFEAYSLILWAQGQRVVDMNAERFLNQMIDLNYVAYGLCCQGLVTGERIIRRLEGGLRHACQVLWP